MFFDYKPLVEFREDIHKLDKVETVLDLPFFSWDCFLI